MQQLGILEAFANLPDPRRKAGQRHSQALYLALFTLAIAAGQKGFLAIGDWIGAYRVQLIELRTYALTEDKLCEYKPTFR